MAQSTGGRVGRNKKLRTTINQERTCSAQKPWTFLQEADRGESRSAGLWQEQSRNRHTHNTKVHKRNKTMFQSAYTKHWSYYSKGKGFFWSLFLKCNPKKGQSAKNKIKWSIEKIKYGSSDNLTDIFKHGKYYLAHPLCISWLWRIKQRKSVQKTAIMTWWYRSENILTKILQSCSKLARITGSSLPPCHSAITEWTVSFLGLSEAKA